MITLHLKLIIKNRNSGLIILLVNRSYDDRWEERNETLNFPASPIIREQQGIKSPLKYQYHWFNMTYNLTSVDKYVFNIALKNQIYNYDNTTAYNNFYSDGMGQRHSSSRNNGLKYIPVLDIYYRQELKDKQSIMLNVVGTYIDSESKKKYLESEESIVLTDIDNKITGSKYSVIGEIVYEKQFEKLTFSAGAKHTQEFANNNYTGGTNVKTELKNSDSYAFAQIQGKIVEKLSYTLGVGGARLWFEEGKNCATYYMFRPSIQLNYSIYDNLSVKLSSIVNARTPSLGQLSDVEQQSDSYQVNRGNPNLKPYNGYRNSLNMSYAKGVFNINTFFGYNYFHKPIMNTYGIEKDKIVSYPENHKEQHYMFFANDITAKIIKDIWTLDGRFSFQRAIFKSNAGNIYTYNTINGSFRSNLQYKNYSFVFGFYSRYKELWGETIYYGDDWSYVETGYKHKEAKLSLGMSYPFKNYWSRGSEILSTVKPSKEWAYIGGNGHMLYLRFSWNMSFGRKHEAGKKSLDNADTDKGVL